MAPPATKYDHSRPFGTEAFACDDCICIDGLFHCNDYQHENSMFVLLNGLAYCASSPRVRLELTGIEWNSA